MTTAGSCNKCGAARGAGAFCATCGTAYAVPAVPRSGPGIVKRLAIVVVVLALIGIAGSAVGSRPAAPRATPGATVIANWYSDADYARYAADRTIAWKWTAATDGWAMMVTTLNGCSSLYVELSVLTNAGTVVGYTNDSVGAVPARGEARLSFSDTDGGSKARLTEISCL